MESLSHVVGYDIPAQVGMSFSEVQTPCLILDLEAFEGNLRHMGQLAAKLGVRLRPHGKMHKSADVARQQALIGGAQGICCQKVSEAEAFVRAGIADVLVSNQARGTVKIDRLAQLPLMGAKVAVCVDDLPNVAELSTATQNHATKLGVLVEIDCGAGRCGVATPQQAVEIARAVVAAPGLRFEGIQAYHGSIQHVADFKERETAFRGVDEKVRSVLGALSEAQIPCGTVTGGGTGSFQFEAQSGLYTELQCGSYAFMDADYGRIDSANGARLDETFKNALFLLTSVMSKPKSGLAICDAGLKVQSVDSGLPEVFDCEGVSYAACSDEHGTLKDPNDTLLIGDQIRLVPGHCDPTCNLHDWYVGMRGDVVECLWPITARGKAF